MSKTAYLNSLQRQLQDAVQARIAAKENADVEVENKMHDKIIRLSAKIQKYTKGYPTSTTIVRRRKFLESSLKRRYGHL